jgi:hypothetical protein
MGSTFQPICLNRIRLPVPNNIFGGYQNEQEYSSSLTWRFENGALHANIEEDLDDLFGGPHIKYELIGDSALVHSNWFPLEKID